MGGDNQEMELQKNGSSQNRCSRVYEDSSDLMDETVTLLTDPADLAVGKQFTRLIVLHVIEQMVADKLVQT
jgi:hypothetical protein